MRIDETRVTKRGVVENIVENEELREHEENGTFNIKHYASRKHLS